MKKGLQHNTIEWELNCSWEGYTYRDLRMHGVGDPMDAVNGIQPCPFVYADTQLNVTYDHIHTWGY